VKILLIVVVLVAVLLVGVVIWMGMPRGPLPLWRSGWGSMPCRFLRR
jgi:hypothetical protein